MTDGQPTQYENRIVGWCSEGLIWDEYTTRGRGNAIRYYIDIDDRKAAEILNRSVNVPQLKSEFKETP